MNLLWLSASSIHFVPLDFLLKLRVFFSCFTCVLHVRLTSQFLVLLPNHEWGRLITSKLLIVQFFISFLHLLNSKCWPVQRILRHSESVPLRLKIRCSTIQIRRWKFSSLNMTTENNFWNELLSFLKFSCLLSFLPYVDLSFIFKIFCIDTWFVENFHVRHPRCVVK
jgi:hypothetical protein